MYCVILDKIKPTIRFSTADIQKTDVDYPKLHFYLSRKSVSEMESMFTYIKMSTP